MNDILSALCKLVMMELCNYSIAINLPCILLTDQSIHFVFKVIVSLDFYLPTKIIYLLVMINLPSNSDYSKSSVLQLLMAGICVNGHHDLELSSADLKLHWIYIYTMINLPSNFDYLKSSVL